MPRLPFNFTAAVMSPVLPTRRVYSCWLSSDGVVSSKMPWFSVKNGRLSLMKVSVALKFTTRSSASTWPKSGFSVAVSWKRPFGFQNRSPPALKSLRPPTLSYKPDT